MVMSTVCRNCRNNYKVEDGKAVSRPKQVARFGSAPPDTMPEPEPAPPPPSPPARRVKTPPKPLHPLLRLFFRPKPPRSVVCFDCGHTFAATAEAQSSQCPQCSCYVSLEDFQIDGPWNREIHTRGNVTILKTGSVTSSSLRAHSLTVIGELRCSAECSGDVTIIGHGRITGSITCRSLRVEKRARVEFLQPVTSTHVIIDGHVRGQFLCSGTVTLRKRSHLHGYVRAAAVVIKSGAKHHGVFETTQPGPPSTI